MPYIKEMCMAGKTVEISKYYTQRCHTKGEKRAKKEKPTCEAQIRVNLRKAIKEMRRLMNNNFIDGDYLVRLDFYRYIQKHGVFDNETMQKLIEKFFDRLRPRMKKAGVPLKYIYVKEIGPKGGRHVHIVMSECPMKMLRECWPHGGIHVDPLNSNGQYARIAEYFAKYAAKTEETEGKLVGKRWYPSRNLKRPIVIKKIISAQKFYTAIQEKKGYTLDKDSIRQGIHEFTGYAYFSYTLIKNDEKGTRGG